DVESVIASMSVSPDTAATANTPRSPRYTCPASTASSTSAYSPANTSALRSSVGFSGGGSPTLSFRVETHTAPASIADTAIIPPPGHTAVGKNSGAATAISVSTRPYTTHDAT